MKIHFRARIKKLFSCCGAAGQRDPNPDNLDVQEEYANAFRTESYNEFWSQVLTLNNSDLSTHRISGATTAARLPSYRLFVDVEHLLDPDQPTVMGILSLTRTRTDILSVLCDYFSNTSDASCLCGQLLKNINRTRRKYKFLKDLVPSENGSESVHVGLTRMARFAKSNPFSKSAQSRSRLKTVQATCSNLLDRLESLRHAIDYKMNRRKRLKFGLIVLVLVAMASLLLIVSAHGLVLLVAAPGLMVAFFETSKMKRMAKWSAQLDSVAKGSYILVRDWDTISRLVDQLNQELEYLGALMQLWLGLRNDRLQAAEEVAYQLKKNSIIFMEKLDELEEHLYLCIMTINRARNLVVKEIQNSRYPHMNSALPLPDS